MSHNSYQDIAKEFLDIWQKQISSVMGDKQFIQAMLDILQNMQKQNHAKEKPANSTTTHDTGGDMLAKLAFRLAMCEKRLAALESQGQATKKTARKAKPSRKSKAAAKRSAGRGSKAPT